MSYVQSSVTPNTVYPSMYTRQAQNMSRALGSSTMPDLRSQYMRPGVSMSSPSLQRAMGNTAGQRMAQGFGQAAATGQQHGFANAQHNLAGQVARNQEALGWGNLAHNTQQFNNAMALQRQQNMLNFLQSAYGSMGR